MCPLGIGIAPLPRVRLCGYISPHIHHHNLVLNYAIGCFILIILSLWWIYVTANDGWKTLIFLRRWSRVSYDTINSHSWCIIFHKLIFLKEMEIVYCEVRTETFRTIQDELHASVLIMYVVSEDRVRCRANICNLLRIKLHWERFSQISSVFSLSVSFQ